MRKTAALLLLLSLLCGCAARQNPGTQAAPTTAAAGSTVSAVPAAAAGSAPSAQTGTTTSATSGTTAVTTSSAAKAAAAVGEDYRFETDYGYSMTTVWNRSTIVEAENGYYFYVPTCMFYMDKSTMEPIPLCGKPNCLHWDEPTQAGFEACQAYFNTVRKPLMYWYEGNLYLLAQTQVLTPSRHNEWELLRVSPDGSRRQSLFTLGENAKPEKGLLHRGVFYLMMTSYTETGEQRTGLWAWSVTDPGKKPECLLEIERSDRYGIAQYPTAWGDCLYFVRAVSEDGQRELCIYNTVTGDLTTLPTDEDGYSPLYATFLGDEMLLEYRTYLPQGDPGEETSFPEKVYRCSLDGKERTLLWEDYGYFAADDRYIFRVSNLYVDPENDHFVYIYDADGRELDRVDLHTAPEGETWRSASLHVSMDGQVFVEAIDRTYRTYLYWFDKAEIGSGQIELRPVMDFLLEYAK